MHDTDLSINEISKVEGHAGLLVKVRDGRVKDVQLKISEYKRFFTQALRGKPIASIPQLAARICGTCSNAHALCAIEALEKALGISTSQQTKILRKLTMNALMIRDHALHLYFFVMPDLLGKDSILEFDENNEYEHKLLHDAFAIKKAGNLLSTLVAGRSVHGPFLQIGGFSQSPDNAKKKEVVQSLTDIRPKVIDLVNIFAKCDCKFIRKTNFVGLVAENYNFLEGVIADSQGKKIPEASFGDYLEHVVIPYSQASGYTFAGETFMVGALARMNLSRGLLNPKTKDALTDALRLFPSENIFHNNLAQAIEVLHCVDESIEILANTNFVSEEPSASWRTKEAQGIGVIEAPRGTLFYKVEINKKGSLVDVQIVVPTGQNQINIEKDIGQLVEDKVGKLSQEEIKVEIEKLIRAYDPCISCATHFLKVKWI